jgi:citrate lyase subunit beta / citryl-CoA lyase
MGDDQPCQRALRSLLFVPADRTDRIAKAINSGADAVIIDLQDSVAAAARPTARTQLRALLVARCQDSGGAPAIFVRVGAAGTPDVELDIEAVCRPGLCGVMVPSVCEPADVRRVDDLLARAEQAAGMEPGTVVIFPGLETPQGIRLTYDIVRTSSRVAYVIGGTSDRGDVARGLGFRWTPEGLESLYLRSKVLLDARAAGIEYPVTGVWPVVADIEGFTDFARQGRQLGYRGVVVIHPSHVGPANDVFTPSAAEIAEWHSVIAQMERLQNGGRGVGTVDGRMIDEAVIANARVNLAWARSLGLRTDQRA